MFVNDEANKATYFEGYIVQKLGIKGLKDDLYLNVLDWSSQCVVAIGASSFVYYANVAQYDNLDHEVGIF